MSTAVKLPDATVFHPRRGAVSGGPFPLSSAAGHTTLPAIHRHVLMWWLEDLVLLFIETDLIKAFRPRSNQRSSTRKLLI